jgi:lia operon protein LiaG
MLAKINMKKIVLALTIVMIGSFGAAGIIANTQGYGGGLHFKDGKLSDRNSINTEKMLDINDINNLQIEAKTANINVIPTDTETASGKTSDKIRVNFHGVYYGPKKFIPKLQTYKNGRNIEIKVERKSPIGIALEQAEFDLKQGDLSLDVYVPRDYAGNMVSRTVSGNFKIAGLSIDRLKHSSVSGNVSISDMKPELTDINMGSGQVTLDMFGGDIKFRSVSGNLNANYSTFNNDIELKTTSGNADIALPKDSKFNVRLDTISGRFNSDIPVSTEEFGNDRHIICNAGDSGNDVVMKSVSGNLNIRSSGQ